MLERLSGPLCDAALERTGSADVLDALDRADLFVTALDPRREWYRCHRLFRDVLLRRLAADPDGRTRVLARAADWFLARGYVAEAVAHRIAAGDEDGAADLLRSQVPAFLERGELAVAPAAGSAAAGGHRAAGRAAVRVPGVGGRPERAVRVDGAVAGRRRQVDRRRPHPGGLAHAARRCGAPPTSPAPTANPSHTSRRSPPSPRWSSTAMTGRRPAPPSRRPGTSSTTSRSPPPPFAGWTRSSSGRAGRRSGRRVAAVPWSRS